MLGAYDPASDSDDPLDVIDQPPSPDPPARPSKTPTRPGPPQAPGSGAKRSGSGSSIKRPQSAVGVRNKPVTSAHKRTPSLSKRRRVVSDSDEEEDQKPSQAIRETGSPVGLARFVATTLDTKPLIPRRSSSTVSSDIQSSRPVALPVSARKPIRRVVSDSEEEQDQIPKHSENADSAGKEEEDAFGIINYQRYTNANGSRGSTNIRAPLPAKARSAQVDRPVWISSSDLHDPELIAKKHEEHQVMREQSDSIMQQLPTSEDAMHTSQVGATSHGTVESPRADNTSLEEIKVSVPDATAAAVPQGNAVEESPTVIDEVPGPVDDGETDAIPTATDAVEHSGGIEHFQETTTAEAGMVEKGQNQEKGDPKEKEDSKEKEDAQEKDDALEQEDATPAARSLVNSTEDHPSSTTTTTMDPHQADAIADPAASIDAGSPGVPPADEQANIPDVPDQTAESPAANTVLSPNTDPVESEIIPNPPVQSITSILPQSPLDAPSSNAAMSDARHTKPAEEMAKSTAAPPAYPLELATSVEEVLPSEEDFKMSDTEAVHPTEEEDVKMSDVEAVQANDEGEEEIDLDEPDVEDNNETPLPDASPKPETADTGKIATSTRPQGGTPLPSDPPPVLLNSKGKPRGKPGPKPKPKDESAVGLVKKGSKGKVTGQDEKKPVKLAAKKGKVEALKSAARARSSSISDQLESATSGSTPEPASATEELDDEGEDDDAIYCSCGKPSRVDGNDTLVGCDGCDNWFHAGCVGFKEEDLGLIDVFFCPNCEKGTGQKTTMKRVCRRDGCAKQFTNKQSKFCSSSCAFHRSHAILGGMQIKKQLKQLSVALGKYPSPPPDIRIIEHYVPSVAINSIASPVTSAPTNQIQLLEQRIQASQAAIDLLEKRILILGRAVEQCETLPPIVQANTAGEDAAGGKTKKRKMGGGDDRPCGWVKALIWDDEEVGKWESEMPIHRQVDVGQAEGDVEMREAEQAAGEEVEYCVNSRKRCDRHAGRQKNINYSLDFELGQMRDTLTSLTAERDHLINAEAVQKAGKISRDKLHELLALQLAKHVV